MATDEELFKLVLKIQGEEQASQLAKQVAAAESKLQQLVKSSGQVATSSTQMSAAIKAEADSLRNLQSQLTQVERANAKLAGGSKANIQGLSQLGYAFDDLQYGFRGIANNIQPILTGFSATAAYAGPIAILAVGVNFLYQNWDSVAKLWGKGGTKSQAEEMEELSKKTGKTADETERLAKWEETRARMTAQGQKPQAVQKEQAAFDKAFAEGPAGAINKGLDKFFGKQIQAQAEVSNPDVYKELTDAKDALRSASMRQVGMNKANPGSGDKIVEESRDRLKAATDAANAAYGEARGRFATDDLHKKEIARAAKANPKDFGPGGEEFAKNIENALNPQNEQMRKIGRVAGEQFGKFWDNLKKEAAKEAEKQLDAEYDEANKETDESIARIKKIQGKDRSEAKGIAGDILSGSNADRFLAGTATDADVTEELKRRGLRTDDPTLIDRVKRATESRANEMGADEATERGLASPEEGRASLRNKMAMDQINDRRQAIDAKVRGIAEQNPDLPGLLAGSIKGNVQAGGTIAEAQNALFGKLADRFGKDAARAMLGNAGNEAEGSLIQDFIGGGDRKDNGPVQVIQGNAALRDSIQSAVRGDDTGRKQLEEIQRTNRILEAKLAGVGGMA